MRITIILLILMIMSVSCIEDEDATNNSGWEKEWGSEKIDVLRSIAIGSEDIIYVGGYTLGNLYSTNMGFDAVLAAFDPNGKELWGKQWSIVDDKSEVWALVADEQGNIYAGGGEYLYN